MIPYGKTVVSLMKAYEDLDKSRYTPENGHDYQSFVDSLNIFQQKYDNFMKDEEFETGLMCFNVIKELLSKVECRRDRQEFIRKFNSDLKKWEMFDERIGN